MQVTVPTLSSTKQPIRLPSAHVVFLPHVLVCADRLADVSVIPGPARPSYIDPGHYLARFAVM